MADIRACLFDLDGVIVDTAHYHFLAWRRLCNELGFDLTPEENEALKGISRAESLNIILQKGGVEVSDEGKNEMMFRKNGWYLEYVNAMRPDEILPGAREFLEKVKASGRKIALGSASKNARPIIEKIEVLHLFDAIVDGNKVTRGKPDPQTFELGAWELGVEPAHCVVFEDAIAGIEAARSAGMYAIGVGQAHILNQAHIVIPGFQGVGLEIFDEL
jgi:beta-phosphoglucomutase